MTTATTPSALRQDRPATGAAAPQPRGRAVPPLDIPARPAGPPPKSLVALRPAQPDAQAPRKISPDPTTPTHFHSALGNALSAPAASNPGVVNMDDPGLGINQRLLMGPVPEVSSINFRCSVFYGLGVFSQAIR